MDLQAEDRAHRIGQKRDVLVIILVCAGKDSFLNTAVLSEKILITLSGTPLQSAFSYPDLCMHPSYWIILQ